MKPQGNNLTFTQGGANGTSSNDYSSAACGLESGKIRAFEGYVWPESRQEQDYANKQTPGIPIEERYIEERTLEDYAQAIQRYRLEYDSEAARNVEQDYREYRAQEAQHRNQPKWGTLRLRYSGSQFEAVESARGDIIVRRGVWRMLSRGARLRGRRKVSPKMSAAAAAVAFVAVFTLTVTPLLHACMFSLRSADAFNWVFSAECSAFFAAIIAWLVVNRRSGNERRLPRRKIE